jgi:hypothetical protein
MSGKNPTHIRGLFGEFHCKCANWTQFQRPPKAESAENPEIPEEPLALSDAAVQTSDVLLHSDSGFFALFELLRRDGAAAVRLLPVHSRRLTNRFFSRWMKRWYRARTMALLAPRPTPVCESDSVESAPPAPVPRPTPEARPVPSPPRTHMELRYGECMNGIRRVTFVEVRDRRA